MFKAAVIGLGNIGMGYDYSENDSSRILSHSKGFEQHKRFDLIAGVDPDPKLRKDFEKKYNKPAFISVDDLYEKLSPEIVSICVPTSLHFNVFQQVIAYFPKAIICEKPIASKLSDAELMFEMVKNSNSILLVNYMRRFEPGVIELKKMIDAGEFGEIYKGVLWYSKGILNNGSHFIDMLIFLFGKVNSIVLLDAGRIDVENDPEPDLKITFGNVDIYFLAGREECYSIKDMELFGTKGSIQYRQGGIECSYRKTCINELFPAYTVLEKNGTQIKTDFDRYQLYVLDALYKALILEEKLNSNGYTALETMRTVDKIISMILEG